MGNFLKYLETNKEAEFYFNMTPQSTFYDTKNPMVEEIKNAALKSCSETTLASHQL